MNRRRAVGTLIGLAAAQLAAGKKEPVKPARKTPTLFLAHGAPMLLDDEQWVGELAAWAKAIPKPKAVMMVSAHWEEKPLTIGATKPVPLVYDFFGFPDRFYKLQYASPGAPELAARVRALVKEAGIPAQDDPARGLDHGTYVPLMAMAPLVISLSMSIVIMFFAV